MKEQAKSVLVVLGSCVLLAASGCAKHEMVKKDEGVAPVASASSTTPVKAEVVKEQPVKQARVAESSVGEVQKNAGQIEELKSALAKIYFDFDSYKLSGTARSNLAKDAQLLKKDSGGKVRIEGNCDERGSDEYNLALGEKRARVAMQYLVTLGIPAERLSVISYGKEKPADPGHDEAAWARNRRDEFAVESK
ncbi:MAG: peptidoglycan-associated lipoprotein Pal [Syntrophobacteraceae bacterium]